MTTSKAAGNVAKLRNFIDVTDPRFGAKGDGSTDDYTAITAAIAALPTGGGIVYFPPGRYVAGTTISANKTGVSLVGASPVGQLGAGSSLAISEIIGGGTNTVILRYGDPTESSADGAHLYPGG